MASPVKRVLADTAFATGSPLPIAGQQDPIEPVGGGDHRRSPRKPTLLNLEHQFEFYGQYHTNPVNVLIHIICVPTIFLTCLVLVHHFSFFPKTVIRSFTLPQWLAGTGVYGLSYELNLSTIASIIYSAYFMLLDPIAGLAYSPILLSFGQWSNVLVEINREQTMRIALGAFVLSWILQFLGHGKFEKRAPALVDNLFQSLVLAVFFVWMEVWFYFGYRPDLKNRLQRRIDLAIAEHKARQARSINNPTTPLLSK